MYLVKQFDSKFEQLSISKGEGLYLYESSGKKYFDMSSGITGHSILGYGHPDLTNGISAQLKRFGHVDFKHFSDGLREVLAELLVTSNENSLDAFYPVGHSGAEACEASMKLSHLLHQSSGDVRKRYFISREQSYHGMSSDALSLGDRPNLKTFENFYPKYRVKIPEHNFLRHAQPGEKINDYGVRSAQYLESKILELGPENVAAFIGETTLGGLVGDVPPSPNYWNLVREVCSKYRVHLILDEVWCGTGTSGKMCSIDWDRITPDFLFMGKTLAAGYGAISGVLTKREYIDSIKKEFSSIPHSVTHQGFSLGVAAAVAAQKIISKPEFLKSVRHKSDFLKSLIIHELGGSNFFRNVRGRGLRISLEFDCPDQHLFGVALANRLKDTHGIILSGKWHRISFSPALTITIDEISMVMDRVCAEFLKLEKEWPTLDKDNIKNQAYF